MNYFLYKLIPTLPTFARAMTPEEKILMDEHFTYWNNLMETWNVVAFGHVADSAGGYEIAIIEADDVTDTEAFGKNDPLIRAGSGFQFKISPMPRIFVRP